MPVSILNNSGSVTWEVGRQQTKTTYTNIKGHKSVHLKKSKSLIDPL